MAFQYNGYAASRQLTRASTSSPLPYRPTTNTPLRGNSSRSRIATYRPQPPSRPRRYPNPPRFRRLKRRTASLRVKIRRPQNGSSFSYYTGGMTKMSRNIYNFWKMNQKYTVNQLISQKLQSTVYGTQAISNIPSLISSDFNDDLARIFGTQTTNQKNTTALIYGTCKDVVTYTNVELTTCYLHIYEITPRYNYNQNPITAWSSGLTAQEDVTSQDSTYPGATPFASQNFCLLYKVNKVYQVQLGPGESHKHTSTYGINRLVHGAIANMAVYTTKFSYWRMYVASGTPINDATNKTFVSTSTISLDIVTNRTWDFAKDSTQRTQRFSSNALSTITSAQVVSDATIETDGNA